MFGESSCFFHGQIDVLLKEPVGGMMIRVKKVDPWRRVRTQKFYIFSTRAEKIQHSTRAGITTPLLSKHHSLLSSFAPRSVVYTIGIGRRTVRVSMAAAWCQEKSAALPDAV